MHHSGWLIITLLVTGCTLGTFDPSQRAGTWMPASDNDANLRVMVVNRHDLVEGAGEGKSAGAEAAPPVARVLTGKRYPLPSMNASTIDSVASPQPQGANNPGPNQ